MLSQVMAILEPMLRIRATHTTHTHATKHAGLVKQPAKEGLEFQAHVTQHAMQVTQPATLRRTKGKPPQASS